MLNQVELKIVNAFKLLEKNYSELKDVMLKLNKDDKQRMIKDYANIYQCSTKEATRAINWYIFDVEEYYNLEA